MSPTRYRSDPFAALLLALLLSVSAANAVSAPHPSASLAFEQTSQLGSWALGLVVPEGSTLAYAQHLSWKLVYNVTAVVRLPTISSTDNTILAVLSVMLSDSSVLQISAGLFPRSDSWRGVGWYISDVHMSPQDYEWVLNSSGPALEPGSVVSLSIFRVGQLWEYRVSPEASNVNLMGVYTRAAATYLKSGDQEVFALESYTSNNTVLAKLGNLTLSSLQVDGQDVTGGTYYISDWDATHHPLFVVGGLPSPSYIWVSDFHNGTFSWSYSAGWRATGLFPQGYLYAAGFAATAVIVAAFFLVAVRKRPPK